MKTKRILSTLLMSVLLALSFFNPSIVVQAAPVGCAASTPASGGYTVTICVTSPANNANLTGNGTVTATASVVGTNPGVQRMVFNLGTAYLLTDYSSPYTFTLPTSKWADGTYVLLANALMRDGFTTGQTQVTLHFINGNATTPVNTGTFTPSTGRAPASGQPFVVAAMGDGASGETTATNVNTLVNSLNPNLLLYLGDVYESGSKAEFYNWYGTGSSNLAPLRSITNPTIGNHEYGNSMAGAGYFDYWNNVPNYYSFNAGGWHFISLNSNSSKINVTTTGAEYAWLQQDLATNTLPCTIAYYHHPLFNIGPEGATTAMSSIWSLLAQNGVKIVLNGHDHDYQRWLPLNGSGQLSSTGITEFVAGGAGHGLQTIATSDSRVAYSNSSNPTAFGVLLLTLSSTGATFSYRSTNGSVLDSGFVACVPGAPTPTPVPTATPTPTNTSTPVPNPVTYNPVADTYVSASSPSSNFGSTTSVRLDSSPDLHAYLRFNVAGLNGRSVSQARLNLFALNSNSQGIRGLGVANNTWGELTTNYTNAPALGSLLATSGSFVSGAWVSLDVTSYITGDGTYSFGVTSLSSTAIGMSSRQSGANAPQLVVTFNTTPLPSSTPTPLPATATSTPLPPATATSTLLPASPTPTSLPAATNTPTPLPPATNTSTPLPPATDTPTPLPAATNTPTPLPPATDTPTPLPPATNTPTPLPVATNTPTPLPPTPTPTSGAGQSLTFTPVADTYVDSSAPTVNNGTKTTLRTDGSPIVNSYLRFNVSGITGTVTRVRLLIFANSSLNTGITANAVADTSWGETSMTYNNAPPMGSGLVTSSSIATSTWVTLTVTGYITADGTYSFGITDPSATAISLASRESGANAPQLIIDTQ